MGDQCKIEDGSLVGFCGGLDLVIESSGGRGTRAQGIKHISLINRETGRVRHSAMAVGGEAKKGLILNFCPFCGTALRAALAPRPPCEPVEGEE